MNAEEIRALVIKVLDAKTAWEDAKLKRDRAAAEYQFNTESLVLARQEFFLEKRRATLNDRPFECPEEVFEDLRQVELVGVSARQAARTALQDLGPAPVRLLVAYMKARGFEFGEFPSRQAHAALIKQVWAHKNPETNDWEYVIEAS